MEIDVLTGETTILQSDIIYDCGQSLNAAVDLGQVLPFISDSLIQLRDASYTQTVIQTLELSAS